MTYVPAPAPDVPHKFQPGTGSDPRWCRCTRHEIDAIHHMPRWHEVATEGLPPRESEVLIWKAGWCDQVVLARRQRNDWKVLDARFDKVGTDDVTHWHPMPTPPMVFIDPVEVEAARPIVDEMLAPVRFAMANPATIAGQFICPSCCRTVETTTFPMGAVVHCPYCHRANCVVVTR